MCMYVCVCERVRILYLCCKHLYSVFFIHSIYFFFQAADEIANTMTRMAVAAAAAIAVAVAATLFECKTNTTACRSAGANCETETKSSRE